MDAEGASFDAKSGSVAPVAAREVGGAGSGMEKAAEAPKRFGSGEEARSLG